MLQEARRHKGETATSIDSIHFKLQKPVSKDESRKSHKAKKKRWWRSALFFFKWKWISYHHGHGRYHEDVHQARARAFRASVSGPVYISENTSGSATPYHRTATSRSSSGPLAGMFTPARKDELDLPYLSLRNLTMEQRQQRCSTSAMPIYLVN